MCSLHDDMLDLDTTLLRERFSLIRFWPRLTSIGRGPSTSRSSATSWASRQILPTTSGFEFDHPGSGGKPLSNGSCDWLRFQWNLRAQHWFDKKIFIDWTRMTSWLLLKFSTFVWMTKSCPMFSPIRWTRTWWSFKFHTTSGTLIPWILLNSVEVTFHCIVSVLQKLWLTPFLPLLLIINGTCDRTQSLWRQQLFITSSFMTHHISHTLLFIRTFLFVLWGTSKYDVHR